MSNAESSRLAGKAADDSKQSLPTLTSLAEETLVSIAMLLDRPSALSLSLTSHFMTPIANKRIWRKVTLSLPTSKMTICDLYPRIQSEAQAWTLTNFGSQAQAQDLEAAKRWMSVKEVDITIGCDRSSEAESIMRRVADSLRTLVVKMHQGTICSFHPTNLDTLLFGRKLPSLTSVSLSAWSIQYAHYIPLLCAAAPALTSLELHLTNDMIRDSAVVSAQGPTRLQYLYCTLYDQAEDCILDVISSLLNHSPLLRQLSIDFRNRDIRGGDDELIASLDGYKPILDAMMRLSNLRDLHYPAHSGHFHRYVNDWTSSDSLAPLSSVRRLVLECNCQEEVIRQWPSLPTVELVAFNHDHSHGRRTGGSKGALHFSSLTFPLSECGHAQLPNMDQLRQTPSLRYLFYPQDSINNYSSCVFDQLDTVEQKGKAPVRISSLRHGGSELLKVRFLVDDREPCDVDDDYLEPRPYDGWGFPKHYSIHHFPAIITAIRRKWFRWGIKPSWHNAYEFEGNAVPEEVVKRMRKAEGASKGDWNRRGVEVSATAWLVLEEWVAERKAEGLWL